MESKNKTESEMGIDTHSKIVEEEAGMEII
jgi:hypothetical protein